MKIIPALILLLSVFSLFAEEGELQLFAGFGGYFPLTHHHYSTDTDLQNGIELPFSVLVGVHDNVDIGIYGSWGIAPDIKTDNISYNTITGQEYANYTHGSITATARWNVVPGYSVAPHLFAGIGLYLYKYKDRELFVDGEMVPHYPAQSSVGILFDGVIGIDATWRLPWWHLLLKGETSCSFTKETIFFSLSLSIGFSWMISSVYTT